MLAAKCQPYAFSGNMQKTRRWIISSLLHVHPCTLSCWWFRFRFNADCADRNSKVGLVFNVLFRFRLLSYFYIAFPPLYWIFNVLSPFIKCWDAEMLKYNILVVLWKCDPWLWHERPKINLFKTRPKWYTLWNLPAVCSE